MKKITVICATFLLVASVYGAQLNLAVIKPEIGTAPDLSEKGQREFKQRSELYERLSKGASIDELKPEEREMLSKYDESDDGSTMWDIMGQGCSWYCGVEEYKVTASSALKPSGGITYEAENAADFSFKNAWIEGVQGYGEGEYLEYFFKNKSPRITDIKIYNGYLKSQAGWKKNSRVKRLKVYVNKTPYAILDLQDTPALQTFTLTGPLGRSSDGKDMVLRFEILEVYKGDAFADTAITELFFDGIDVHCLAKGTLIATLKGEQPIETISVGDRVKQYDPVRAQMTSAAVTKVIKADHSHMLALKLEDGSTITTTADHPFWISGKGWCKHQPGGAQAVREGYYEVGDCFLIYDTVKGVREVRLKEISDIDAPAETYTLELDSGVSFLANGLVTGTEHDRGR